MPRTQFRSGYCVQVPMVRMLWSISELRSSTALSQALTSGKVSSKPPGTRIAASILNFTAATVILHRTLEQLIEGMHFLSFSHLT